MIAIVTQTAPEAYRPYKSLRPYLITQDTLFEEDVRIYHLSSCYRPFFPKIQTHLQKKHPNLIFSAELEQEEPLLSQQLFPKLQEIFTLTDQGTPRTFAVLCDKGEKRLPAVLKTVSPFARSVSLVTHCPTHFERVSQEALEEYGLSITQRDISQLEGTHLTLLLSGEFNLSKLRHGYLVNLSGKKISAPIPTLCDLTAKETSEFLIRHPNLRLKHFQLLPESARVTNLVWMYC